MAGVMEPKKLGCSFIPYQPCDHGMSLHFSFLILSGNSNSTSLTAFLGGLNVSTCEGLEDWLARSIFCVSGCYLG